MRVFICEEIFFLRTRLRVFFFFSGTLIKVKFQTLFRASVSFWHWCEMSEQEQDTCQCSRIEKSQTNLRQDRASQLTFLILFPHHVKGITSKHRLVRILNEAMSLQHYSCHIMFAQKMVVIKTAAKSLQSCPTL